MMSAVRLSDAQLKKMMSIFKKIFAENDRLWLFGSRVDLHKKGGDIDLFIETQAPIAIALDKRGEFYAALILALGEQKIDIVVKCTEDELPIYIEARQKGIRLV